MPHKALLAGEWRPGRASPRRPLAERVKRARVRRPGRGRGEDERRGGRDGRGMVGPSRGVGAVGDAGYVDSCRLTDLRGAWCRRPMRSNEEIIMNLRVKILCYRPSNVDAQLRRHPRSPRTRARRIPSRRDASGFTTVAIRDAPTRIRLGIPKGERHDKNAIAARARAKSTFLSLLLYFFAVLLHFCISRREIARTTPRGRQRRDESRVRDRPGRKNRCKLSQMRSRDPAIRAIRETINMHFVLIRLYFVLGARGRV